MALHYTPEELHEPEYDQEKIINALWDSPGSSWDQLHKRFGVKTIGEHRGFGNATDALLEAERILVVRFTTYAPFLKTHFCLFPVEKGRLEIVNANGEGYCLILDRHGKWDELMEKALREA